MKILIIGHPGSGKTYLANKLSQKLKIEQIDIDVLFDKHPLYLFSKKLHRRALKKLVDLNKEWIIDGYHTGRMPKEILNKANRVIFLNLPKEELKSNIVNRYQEKKAAREFSHWQSFRINNLKNFAQLRLEDKALRSEVEKIKTMVKNEQFKELKSKQEIDSYVNEIQAP